MIQTDTRVIKNDDGTFGGYLATWGSWANPDLQGEYFTAETDFVSEPPWPVMLLPEHFDRPLAEYPQVGRVLKVERDSLGLRCLAQVDADLYQRLSAEGVLDWALATEAHFLIRTAANGRILTWPVSGIFFTPQPAQPLLSDRS